MAAGRVDEPIAFKILEDGGFWDSVVLHYPGFDMFHDAPPPFPELSALIDFFNGGDHGLAWSQFQMGDQLLKNDQGILERLVSPGPSWPPAAASLLGTDSC